MEKWLAWIPGNGANIRLELDLIISGPQQFSLSVGIMNALHNNGFRHLYQIYQGYQPSHATPTWINTGQIGLSEGFRVEWDTYINALRQNVIGLST